MNLFVRRRKERAKGQGRGKATSASGLMWEGTGCDGADCLQIAAISTSCYLMLFACGRFVFYPALFPETYSQMAKTPGAQGFFDSSVASTINSYLGVLAVLAFMRTPELLSSSDAYLKNQDTCRLVVLFLSWNIFDLCHLLVMQWRHEAQWAMLVHHVCAVAAWLLYLEGGYGHALSLVGLCCEFTNPCMNMRYFLVEFGLRDSKWYFYNGLAFVFAWMLVRISFAIPVGSYLIASQWSSLASLPAWRRYCFAGFFGVGCMLNLMWGAKLFRGAYKVLTATKSAPHRD